MEYTPSKDHQTPIHGKDKSSIFKKFLKWLFSSDGYKTLVGAIIGAVVTVLVTVFMNRITGNEQDVSALSKSIHVQTSELQTQTSVLEKGFEELQSTLEQQVQLDPQVSSILEKLSSTVSVVSNTSIDLTNNANLAADIISFHNQASQLPSGVKEIWVSGDNMNAARIDRINDIAVLKDVTGDGMEIRAKFNGSSGTWTKGGRKNFESADGEKSALTYMAKSGNHYLFHRLTLE